MSPASRQDPTGPAGPTSTPSGAPRWRRWVGLGLSAVAVGILLWRVDLAAMAQAFTTLSPGWLALSAGALVSAWGVQAVRWRVLLPARPRVPLGRLLGLVLIGYFGNLVLPLRAGDVLRVVLLRRALGGQAGHALASVGLDRILDVAALVAISGLVALLVDLPAGWRAGLGVVAALLGVAVAGIVGLAVGGPTAERLVSRLPLGPLRPRVRGLVGQVATGVSVVTDLRTLAALLGLSAVQWGLAALSVWAVLVAFDPTLPLAASGLFLVATNLGSALPSAPAAVGVYHGLGVLALQPFGVSAEAAMAMALVSHALFVAVQFLGGLVAVWYEGGAGVLEARHESPGSPAMEDA